jgi:hypothetical protein
MIDGERLLREFLRERDVECPACGYNLRDLEGARCPECREVLRLQVGCQRARFGLFIAALTPCVFSGIAGLLLLVPILLEGNAPGGIVQLDSFGLSSGLVGAILIWQRERFIRQSTRAQLSWVLLLWLVHLVAFAMLLIATR